MHYRWLSVLSAFSAALLADLATPPAQRWGDIRVKHTWNTVPADWESLGTPPAGTTINLHVALTPHRENALIDALYEVSNPRHQKYGAHLSKEQVAELVAPHQGTLEIVHSWLEHHGVPSSSISTSHGGGWLTITGVPVSRADELLSASYQLYRHTGTNETEVILRTVGYSLPAALHAHIQTVAPTTHFASPRTPLQTPRKGSSEGATLMLNATSGKLVRTLSKRSHVDPPFLRWLYRTEAYVPVSAELDRSALGILGLHNKFPVLRDLRDFMLNYRVDAETAAFNFVEVNGGVYNPRLCGDVENIHLQYATAMAYPTRQIFYATGGSFRWHLNDGAPAYGDAYLAWFYYLLHGLYIPPTISISNIYPEIGFPQEYARALCHLFAQLGLRGTTVLVASGDDGVGRGDCEEFVSEDRPKRVRFIPMFPASCPWVTSVGGTIGRLRRSEIGARLSGGGFSNYFPFPRYQANAVPAFLTFLGIEYAGYYQPEGRGIPDVAAQADNFIYVSDSVLKIASSTSCSAATVAGIVSLLNDYLLSTGMPPLGFLNPLLYVVPDLAGVNDVRHGSNPGCNTEGFQATIGWDPVTGVGTLDFVELVNTLARLIRSRQPSGTTSQATSTVTIPLPSDNIT